MQAMILHAQGEPLQQEEVPKPSPSSTQLLLKVHACGICRTDLHILDKELEHPKLPLIPGHQIVGTVEEMGSSVSGFTIGERVGVPWLGSTCGHCFYCTHNRENLCDDAAYTGYTLNGGFAEYCVAEAAYSFPLPEGLSDTQVAPLICAGLIGYRAFRKADPENRLGLYGFGSAAHILTQIATQQGIEVYAFTREGDRKGQDFACSVGACWAGSSDEKPAEELDAAIIFAPVGALIPLALKAVRKGGRVICGGIHMSDIPSFPYKDLWEERSIESVANLTREDANQFFTLIRDIPLKIEVTTYPLDRVNEALEDLRSGAFSGSAVITLTTSEGQPLAH